jgi:hypothetical protein
MQIAAANKSMRILQLGLHPQFSSVRFVSQQSKPRRIVSYALIDRRSPRSKKGTIAPFRNTKHTLIT